MDRLNPDRIDPERRSLLFSVGSLGISQLLPQGSLIPSVVSRQGYVLGAEQGENLVHFRDGSRISIKISPETGSESLALGTQQVMAGAGIPVHRHFHMDEAFSILEGSGTFILNDERHTFANGGTIFIPRNSWHGFENPDHELLLLWVVSPPGLERFFRETCTPPGVPRKHFNREQINDIARRYGTEFR